MVELRSDGWAMMPTPAYHRSRMRAVDRILAVFECFTPQQSSMSLQSIADSIDLPKSTTFRIVQSLERAGYLVRLENQQYCLSFRFTRLAGVVRSTLGIREISRSVMAQLAEGTQETVAIHTVSGRNRVCIDTISAMSSQLRTVMQPGFQIPLLVGSASKVLMAHRPDDELKALVAHVARSTKRPKADVLSELAKVRRQGFAVSHGERLAGMSAISAPIWDANEEVHYCLTVNGPTIRIQPKQRDFVSLVVEAAGTISLQFGGQVSASDSASPRR